jgi:hypothetical protein
MTDALWCRLWHLDPSPLDPQPWTYTVPMYDAFCGPGVLLHWWSWWERFWSCSPL